MSRKKVLILVSSLIGVILAIFVLFMVINNKKDLTYNVSFNTNGGTFVNTQAIKKGEKAEKPDDPTREGYIFVRWVYEGNTYDFNLDVTSNIVIEAEWKKENEDIQEFTVSFDSDGGTTISNQIIEKGNKVIKPEDPTKDGYKFKNWTLGTEIYDFDKTVEESFELKANWEEENDNKEYTVRFDSNGGSSVTSKTVESGSTVKKPSNPTRSGYKFVEWQLNGKSYNFNNKVTSNITLKAVWKQNVSTKYTVTFDSNGGSSIANQTVESGSTVAKPSNPTRSGYKFVEWQLNGKSYNFSNKVTSNITLKAIWEENTITFRFNNLDEITYEVSDRSLVKINEEYVADHCLNGGMMCNDVKYTINPLKPGTVTIRVKADLVVLPNPNVNMLDLSIVFNIKEDLSVDTVHVNINKDQFEYYGLKGSCKRMNSDVFNRIYSCELQEPTIN